MSDRPGGRRLKLSAYTAILLHVLVLQISTVTRGPSFVRADPPCSDWRGLVFVDATEIPHVPSQRPTEDTRVISQKNYRESDRSPDDAGDTPASRRKETDAPHDPRESAARATAKEHERKGPGKIQLHHRGRLATKTVTGEGVVTEGALMYNIKQHEYADYYKHIRDRVVASWEARYSHDLHRLLQRNNRATVLFRVERDGSIRGVRPGPDQTRNLELVTKLMQVIRNAEPLERFPEKIAEPHLPIRFDFYFF
jgi:hypothetical protein